MRAFVFFIPLRDYELSKKCQLHPTHTVAILIHNKYLLIIMYHNSLQIFNFCCMYLFMEIRKKNQSHVAIRYLRYKITSWKYWK
jgi:hypothetical protein